MADAHRYVSEAHIDATVNESLAIRGFDVDSNQREALTGSIVDHIDLESVDSHTTIAEAVLFANGDIGYRLYTDIVKRHGWD